MRKVLFNKSYMEYYNIPLPDSDFVPERPKRDVVENSDSSRAILQAIYALDPVTRLPNGDIMCYMASNTPPEIKQYILDNLMIDVSSQALPKLPEGIDADVAFALERKVDESLDSYRSRVTDYMTKQVELRDMAIENAKRQASQQPAQ